MRIRILCAVVLAAAHAATASAQPPTAVPLSTGDGWVALTIADYLKLREQAHPRPTPPAPPAVRATVSEAAYELTAGEGLATGTAELVIDVLDDGWVEVPLPPSLFVRSARLGGRPLAIADGRILLSRRGRSIVTLDVAVPIAETAGNESVQLPPAAGGLLRVSLAVPRGDVAIVATASRSSASGRRGSNADRAQGFGRGPGLSCRERGTPAITSGATAGTLRHLVASARYASSLRAARSTCCARRLGVHAVGGGPADSNSAGCHFADWTCRVRS